MGMVSTISAFRLVKILYIESDFESSTSKHASREFEKYVKKVMESQKFICSFTVVTNAFSALECTQHTFFDMIFCRRSIPHISASMFSNMLKTVGSNCPIIAILECDENPLDSSDFFGFLKKPYTNTDLCAVICQVVDFELKSKSKFPTELHKTASSNFPSCSSNDLLSASRSNLTAEPNNIDEKNKPMILNDNVNSLRRNNDINKITADDDPGSAADGNTNDETHYLKDDFDDDDLAIWDDSSFIS